MIDQTWRKNNGTWRTQDKARESQIPNLRKIFKLYWLCSQIIWAIPSIQRQNLVLNYYNLKHAQSKHKRTQIFFQPSNPRNKRSTFWNRKWAIHLVIKYSNAPKQAAREMNLTQNQIDVTDPSEHPESRWYASFTCYF